MELWQLAVWEKDILSAKWNVLAVEDLGDDQTITLWMQRAAVWGKYTFQKVTYTQAILTRQFCGFGITTIFHVYRNLTCEQCNVQVVGWWVQRIIDVNHLHIDRTRWICRNAAIPWRHQVRCGVSSGITIERMKMMGTKRDVLLSKYLHRVDLWNFSL